MRILIISGILLLLTLTSSLAIFSNVQAEFTSTPIGVFYYIWYGYNSTSQTWPGGWGTSHWTTADGIVDEPTIGYYSSMDNSTLQWQFEQMQKYNITFLIVSWWNDYTSDSLLNLYKYVHANGGVKLAVMIEPYDNINVTQAVNYIWQNYYSAYPNDTMNWQGRPLLCSFNPVQLPVDLRFTVRSIGHMDGVDWSYWQSQQVNLRRHGGSWGMAEVSSYTKFPQMAADGEVTVVKSYDDRALYWAYSRSHYMIFTYSLDNQLAYAKTHASLIILTSWNEWSERTALEPSLHLVVYS